MAPRLSFTTSSPTSDEAEDLATAQLSTSRPSRQHRAARGKAPRPSQQPAAPLYESEDNQAAESTENAPGSGARLKTSKEVYDLVRTEPGYDAQKCHIVYHDRVANRYMRTALADWTPASAQGDVPWHRVWFFTYDGTVFWDRERRCFDHALLRRLASGDAAPSYQSVTRGAQSVAETVPSDLRIATLSLVGSGDGRRESASNTISEVSTTLRDLDADVIMLQKCTEGTRESLEEQDWVRNGYEVVYSNLEPSGQITLARAHHTRASQHSFSASNKSALRVCFKTENGVDFETWNTDFETSTEKGLVAGKADRRRSGKEQSGTESISQLEQWTHVAGIYPAIVAGDFSCCNRKDDVGPFSQDADRGWYDALVALRHHGGHMSTSQAAPEDHVPGETSQAAACQRTGGETTLGCSSRIFVRSSQLVSKASKLFPVRSEPSASEHFGIWVDVNVDPSRAVDDWERLERSGTR